jgi:hypothetical protein
MNLPTHVVAAFAIGIALFHNVELALIMSMGAVIPDLDRDYFFVARDFIGRHQTHRALFHNFFLAGLLYLVSPFLALGALSHYFLDIFTSATDRGVELLYPFTRLVDGSRWLYTIEGEKKPNESKKLKWWVEDPYRLLKNTTDPDLQEPEEQSWRRSYGPFKNSRIVDWGIFLASVIFIIILVASFALGTNFYSLAQPLALSSISLWGLMIFFLGVLAFYLTGYWYQKQPEEEKQETMRVTSGGLILGVILLLVGGVLGWTGGIFFLPSLSSSTLVMLGTGLLAIVIGFAISYAYGKTQDLTL